MFHEQHIKFPVIGPVKLSKEAALTPLRRRRASSGSSRHPQCIAICCVLAGVSADSGGASARNLDLGQAAAQTCGTFLLNRIYAVGCPGIFGKSEPEAVAAACKPAPGIFGVRPDPGRS